MDDRPALPTRYDPDEVEPRLYARSLAAGVFSAEPDPSRPPFVISMPPPNITGRAHLGHGSTYTPMDVLTRYHRMRGDNSVWLPGQDHAAIATETVLVRELAREGASRESLGRERYLERAWKWRELYGNTINEQFQRLGFGPDWQRDRFTMDPGLSKAVLRVFVELYRQGLIYRGTRLVNWDPVAHSTLSDAEVENDERDTFLWHLRYRAEDGGDGVVVATTRPETYFADVAVAVHPSDERYRHLIGKNVVLPIVGRPIPVIADDAVESSFGTGAVKVTPAHDPTDYEIGTRHALPMPTVIDYDGRICTPVWHLTDQEPGDAERDVWTRATAAMAPYVGLDRFAARDRLTDDLRASGGLVRQEPYHTTVPISSRSGAVIEPLLSLQWFCKMESLAARALDAHRSGRITFVPERFGRTFDHGLEGIKDWNVSRQVWWGHQLPVWYTPDGTAVVAETEEEALAIARRDHGTAELTRDPDTLDTWFSSGLWPFSILGWPDRTPELEAWYPNQVMITGRDIIFLWVARMVMLGLHFVDEVPFTTVFIAPLVFDLHGRKMSKSLGNAIDPMTDLVPKYGADGTRFGILKQMRLESQELRFDERLCDEAKRFATKLWNALRYLGSLPEGMTTSNLPPAPALTLADRWILGELRACVETVTRAYDGFEFGVAADAIQSFGWYRLCDWYLQATKAEAQRATRAAVLAYALDVLCRLMHPIAPFITEEIWNALPGNAGAFLSRASWPAAHDIPPEATDGGDFAALIATVERLREARLALGLGAKERVTLHGGNVEPVVGEWLRIFAGADVRPNGGVAAGTAFADVLAALRIEADPGALRDRYGKEIARLETEVARLEKKLGNAAFVANGKPEVVAAEREKLAGYTRDLQQARGALAELGSA